MELGAAWHRKGPRPSNLFEITQNVRILRLKVIPGEGGLTLEDRLPNVPKLSMQDSRVSRDLSSTERIFGRLNRRRRGFLHCFPTGFGRGLEIVFKGLLGFGNALSGQRGRRGNVLLGHDVDGALQNRGRGDLGIAPNTLLILMREEDLGQGLTDSPPEIVQLNHKGCSARMIGENEPLESKGLAKAAQEGRGDPLLERNVSITGDLGNKGFDHIVWFKLSLTRNGDTLLFLAARKVRVHHGGEEVPRLNGVVGIEGSSDVSEE
jgi:hypothetical protein